MAKVIIGIHGLGNKPPGQLLEKWWKISMIEGLKLNGHNKRLPRFELVYWADVIHSSPQSESETDSSSPYYIDEKYTKAPVDFHAENHDTRKKVVSFLGRQMNRIFLNEDLSLNYSFISDTIMKKYFRDLEIYYKENCTLKTGQTAPANEIIRGRLAQKLQEHRKDRIMLISHSMGSIIAFDVLSFLTPHINIDTLVTIGSPLGFPLVISRIADEQKKMTGSVKHLSTPPSVVRGWYNYSDILDKVAFNYKLSESFKPNSHGISPTDILVVNNYMSNGTPNPHKSFGYLRTPEFSELLAEFTGSGKITLGRKIVQHTGNIIRSMGKRIAVQRKLTE
jgi:hypothetical protein